MFLKKSIKYWNTLRYLKFVQIVGRIKCRFRYIKIDLSKQPKTSVLSNNWTQPIGLTKRMVDKNTFCFLNETHKINNSTDWNNNKWNKLWLYNLHYFDDLNAVNAEKRIDWHHSLIKRWVSENPPNDGNGWEPYPSSLRIINWIKWALAGNELEYDWEHSLAVQVRYLSNNLETHLLGNHLFANAKALLFAGLFFKGSEAQNWYQIGLKIVEKELPEQVLADGGNFELSTMYHAIFLQDLLDLVNVHYAFSYDLPLGLKERIKPMFNWLSAMSHPDGKISFFNDAAFGIAPTIKDLYSYGARLCLLDTNKQQRNNFINLPESGYSRVILGDAVALIDRAAVGADYLPAHAHADTLSFELSLFGQRVIVNSGTSVYGIGEERQRQRGTPAHATVAVDGENSSEVWGGFRVAKRAKVFDCKSYKKDKKVKLSACHNGYWRLFGKPTHCRQWHFFGNSLVINDKITGRGNHDIDVVLPLHPDIDIVAVENSKVILNLVKNRIKICFEGEGFLKVKDAFYHPEFGVSNNNKQLIYQLSKRLPVKIITRISW